MRSNRFIFTACAVALAAAVVVGAGARWYRAIGARAHELEAQNASLLTGYDELRGFAIECLVREEERIVADTYAGVDAHPRVPSDARHRARHAASTDTH